MSDEILQTSVQHLPGGGAAPGLPPSKQMVKLLKKLGIQTVEDLLWYLPREIHDLTDVRNVFQLESDTVQTVIGVVEDRDAKEISGGRTVTVILLNCDGVHLRGVWFNQPWMLQRFQLGQEVSFSGKFLRKYGRWEVSSPKVQWLDDANAGPNLKIECLYGLTEGLKVERLREVIQVAVQEYAEYIPEHLPREIREQYNLPTLSEAIEKVHMPATVDEYEAARRRLIFDDLLEFQLGLALRRKFWRKQDSAPKLPISTKIDARIRRLFPFQFTNGQNTAIDDVVADLISGYPMHRLLQADVGAGKTVVALYAILLAIAHGYQAVLMAPTEVLATQHWQTVDSALARSRVQRLFLTGQLTTKQRRMALDEIADGTAQLVIGTQAIIQDDVQFHRLGVVVIDEQHKFGVMQRAHFSSQFMASPDPEADESSPHQGNLFSQPVTDSPPVESPHVLVMTATPIPRSLCLTQFGDLDVSTITESPPGRQEIHTHHIPDQPTAKRSWNFIREQLEKGRQAYIVCPRVESVDNDNPAAARVSAESVAETLAVTELSDYTVGLVHGRLDREEKAAVMEQFREGKIQALISTTVVEVGVDVPNATIMVIYQAEFFGLSQLHQLRGRIGRGRFQSYCFLCSSATSEDARERLEAMVNTTDGFRIAEIDFALRGPGDVLGTRQHGEVPLRVANILRDQALLRVARKAAFELVETETLNHPDYAALKIRVQNRFGKMMNLPKTG